MTEKESGALRLGTEVRVDGISCGDSKLGLLLCQSSLNINVSVVLELKLRIGLAGDSWFKKDGMVDAEEREGSGMVVFVLVMLTLLSLGSD